MLFKVEGSKSKEPVCPNLEKTVIAHKFGVMSVHGLHETTSLPSCRVAYPHSSKGERVCLPSDPQP